MEPSMTKSRTLAAALAALTMAAALTVSSGQAQAHSHRIATAAGIGFAFGALAGATVARPYYVEPVYECHYERRINRWGRVRLIKVCSAY
jgi:hypothetical protein